MQRFALLVLALMQADSGEQFYRFRPGTSWTFRQSEGDKSSKSVLTVVKEEGGKVMLESRDFRGEGKEPRTSSVAWSVEEGYVVWLETQQGRPASSLRVYKVGSRKGDTWKSPLGEGREMEATHMGTEEVKVPAGIYKDAVRIELKMAQGATPISLEFSLAPGVGPVRMGGTVGGKRMLMELAEHKEAK